MYNQIMDAVTQTLDGLFGEDGFTIYTDEVGQDLQEPCFFVSFLEPSEKQRIGNRYYRETGVAIQFIPGETDQLSRMLHQVAETLMEGMEYIQMPDEKPVRGTGMKWQISDGILNFFVNYNLFIYKAGEEPETMGELQWKGELK